MGRTRAPARATGPQPTQTGRLDVLQRQPTEREAGPTAGFTRGFDRNWSVDTDRPGSSALGIPIRATNPAGNWARGQLYRQASPVLSLGPYFGQWDRSDPVQWDGPPAYPGPQHRRY